MLSSFYLPSLMRIDELDIRGLAASENGITGLEYLAIVEKFVEAAKPLPDTLMKMTSRNHATSVENAQDLTNTAPLLKEMSANALSDEFEEILAGKPPEEAFAERFGQFYARVKNLMHPPKSLFGDDGAHDPAYARTLNLGLAAVISALDEEEKKRKLRVMAVDDTAVMLHTISSALSDYYKVNALANPMMVEMFLDHVVPELFLLDYKMPKLSGLDLIPIIRGKKEHKNTPIIFLTASGTEELIKTAMGLGACDFIVKPCKADVLLKKVVKHIERKTAF